MKRISINYGGLDYTIANQDLEVVKAQILQGQTFGPPLWLRVNHGEGSYQETDLLIAPGIPIAIAGIDAD